MVTILTAIYRIGAFIALFRVALATAKALHGLRGVELTREQKRDLRSTICFDLLMAVFWPVQLALTLLGYENLKDLEKEVKNK